MANSFRVVNQDAPVYFKPTARDYNGEEIGIESYRKSGTTEITPDWKPEDWESERRLICQCHKCASMKDDCPCDVMRKIEATRSACLEALGRVKGK